MAQSTAEYYRKNPKARLKRLKQQAAYNKKTVSERVELNRINRQKGTYGNGDGKDVSHRTDGSTIMEDKSKNRSRNRARLKIRP
jgi:hypothetical protein